MINSDAKERREDWIERKCKEVDENMVRGNTERAYVEIRRQFNRSTKILVIIQDTHGK